MIRPPLDALAAAFALGACVGAATVLTVVLAVMGARALWPAARRDRADRRGSNDRVRLSMCERITFEEITRDYDQEAS